MPIRRAAIVAALSRSPARADTVRSAIPPAARADRRTTSAATAILVDVVVRDRRGVPSGPRCRGFRGLRGRRQSEGRYVHPRVAGGGIGVGVAWKAGGRPPR